MKNNPVAPFWKEKSLEEMTPEEWESICDGCAKCCLNKMEDPDTKVVQYTNVSCYLLSLETCTCKSYENRGELVPGCALLSPEQVKEFYWLPKSCAYRLLSEGKELPPWHHLICGDKERIHREEHSVYGKVISEDFVHPDWLDQFVVDWD